MRVLVGYQAEPDPPAEALVRVGEVEVPALAPQRLVAGGCAASSSADRAEAVRRTAASGRIASASVSRTCWQCRRSMVMNIWSPRSVRSTSIDDTIAIITPKKLWRRTPSRTSSRSTGATGAERFVVGPQQRVVVVAARLDRQRAAEEVGHIGQRRAPGDGLPVDHGQRPVGAGLAEQHVVEAVVAVDQALHPVFCRFGGE